MAEKRKADVFAGLGSLAGKLKNKRKAIEDGDPTGGDAFNSKEKIDDRKDNTALKRVTRGYQSLDSDE